MQPVIELTMVSEGGNQLFVNVGQIVHFRKVGKATRVSFAVAAGEKIHALTVTETPEQIRALIERPAPATGLKRATG